MELITVINLKNVGENLQDHLQLRVIYKLVNAKTLNQQINSVLEKLKIGMEYIFQRKGPMSMAPKPTWSVCYVRYIL